MSLQRHGILPVKNIIKWNNSVKLIISDVDETIADIYVPAEKEICIEIQKILEEGKILFLISGNDLKHIVERVVNPISKSLRKRIIIGHCSGAEVWGFNEKGELLGKPFYSLYESSLSDSDKKKWREIIRILIKEFHLKTFPARGITEFRKITGDDPFSIIFEDRGPQITFDFANSYDLNEEKLRLVKLKLPQAGDIKDLRIPVIRRAEELLKESDIPVTPRMAGVFAIDFAIKEVSKKTAVSFVLGNDEILLYLGLNKEILSNPENIEVWGDKFSIKNGGTDRHISEALPREVRSITFREENPGEFPEGYNIVIWNGRKHLHYGLLEYLKSRIE